MHDKSHDKSHDKTDWLILLYKWSHMLFLLILLLSIYLNNFLLFLVFWFYLYCKLLHSLIHTLLGRQWMWFMHQLTGGTVMIGLINQWHWFLKFLWVLHWTHHSFILILNDPQHWMNGLLIVLVWEL